MSAEWIKVRVDLREDPAVFRLAKLTKLDRLSVIGRLWAFWSWADKHAVDGHVDGAEVADVDDITDKKGFAQALAAVGWLEIGDGFVAIPKHDRHNGESAKERSLKNARQAKWRQNRDANVDTKPSTDVDASPSTQASTREEKKREEEIKDKQPSVVPDSRSASTPAPPLRGDVNLQDIPKRAIVPLDAGFELPLAWGEDAEKLGYSPAQILHEAERFRQYYVSGKGAGTKRGTKGWRQSWSNWLNNTEKFGIRRVA